MFYVMKFVDQREFRLSRLRFVFAFVVLLRSRLQFHIPLALHLVVPPMGPQVSLFDDAIETIERLTLTTTRFECEGV